MFTHSAAFLVSSWTAGHLDRPLSLVRSLLCLLFVSIVFRWCVHCSHNCQPPLAAKNKRCILLEFLANEKVTRVGATIITASISSSSSSTVDTVTELNLPIFFVCFVTNTLRGCWVVDRICLHTSPTDSSGFSFFDWTKARLSTNVTLLSGAWR